MPLVATPPGSVDEFTAKPPGHMQKLYTLRAPHVAVMVYAAGGRRS
jgi:hypothetical protein